MFEILYHSYPDNVNSETTTVYHSNREDLGLAEASLSVELNTAGTLEMHIPITHPYYAIFELRVGECSVRMDDEEIWRGFVSEESVDFDGTKTVVCTGIQAYLNDSVISIAKGTYTPADLLDAIIENHNSQMTKQETLNWTRPLPNKTFDLFDAHEFDQEKVTFDDNDSYDISWNLIETNLISEFGGYIKVWRDGNVNKISYTKSPPGSDDPLATQKIEYGKNLLDLNFSITTEDFFTVLIPTAQSVNGKGIVKIDPIINSENANKYGYVWQTFSLNSTDAKDDNTLKTKLGKAATEKLSKAGAITSIEGKAVDWHYIDINVEAIKLGDKNLIISRWNGLDGDDAFVCNRIDYDILRFEESEYAFGDVEKTMTSDQICKLNKVADMALQQFQEDEAVLNQALSQTTFYIFYTIEGQLFTSDRTVKNILDALQLEREFLAIDSNNGNSYEAEIVCVETGNNSYTVTVTLNISGIEKKWSGSGLSESDDLNLYPVNN